MAYMFDEYNHDQYFVPEPGVVITWEQRYEDVIARDVRFRDEDVMTLSNNSYWGGDCQCIDGWPWLEYQSTTGIDFVDHIGGGHIIDVTDGDNVSLMSIAVEWNDDWISDNGIDGHDNKDDCMEIACRCLREFVENLPNR